MNIVDLWLTNVDQILLTFLDETEARFPPVWIQRNLEERRGTAPSSSQIQLRLTHLREAGLVDRSETSGYRITDLGQRAVRGGLDREELEELDPGEVR